MLLYTYSRCEFRGEYLIFVLEKDSWSKWSFKLYLKEKVQLIFSRNRCEKEFFYSGVLSLPKSETKQSAHVPYNSLTGFKNGGVKRREKCFPPVYLAYIVTHLMENTQPEFVNILRGPGIDSLPGGPVREPYLTYLPARLHRAGRMDSWAPQTFTNTGSVL